MTADEVITLLITETSNACANICEAQANNPDTAKLDAPTALRIVAAAIRIANNKLVETMAAKVKLH